MSTPQPKPKPKFEYRNRAQVYFGPVDLEALVPASHPARAVWDLIETLDFARYEDLILSREGQAGRSAAPPRLLAALWIYGYSLGVGPARALERMQTHEPGLRWLCADEPVNYHTLSDFRVAHEKELDELFSQVLAAIEQVGLLDLTTVVHDGTKVLAVGSRASFHRRRAALRVSDSEPEARKMKMPDGGFAPAYNVQLSAETHSNVLVSVDVTQEAADVNELVGALRQIQRRLGRRPERLLADGGYASRENVESASRQKIELYAPWKEDAERHKGALRRHGIAEEYGPQAFAYQAGPDVLICPAGERLVRQSVNRKHGVLKVLYEAPAEACAGCARRERCSGKTGPGRGRRVDRVQESAAMQAYLARMAGEEGQQVYKQRSRYGEFAQLQIKGVLRLRRFHVRGLKKVKQEGKLWALAYSVLQWIRLGWKKLINPPEQFAPAAY